MRKALTAAMAAITLGGALCVTAGSAEAQRYHGGNHGNYGGHYRHGNNGGAAVAAGVLGLALGAAIASDHGYSHNYYNRGYGYYGGPAYYDYGPSYYRTCVSTRWVWDPYIGRRVPVRESYAC